MTFTFLWQSVTQFCTSRHALASHARSRAASNIHRGRDEFKVAKKSSLLFYEKVKQRKGAFTPDANDANRANYLHVKSKQRRERQTCGAIRANEAARMARIERFFRAIRAIRKIWTLADIRVALTNQELALAVTSLRAEAENPHKKNNNNGGQSNCGCMWAPGAVYTSLYFYKNRNTFCKETGAAWQKPLSWRELASVV